MFLSKHIPVLSENQKKYNDQLKNMSHKEVKNDKIIAHFKKELDELTTVWAQEEEKTRLM